MTTKSQRPRGWEGALSSLNIAINSLNGAKGVTSTTPAEVALASSGVLLATIRDSMVSKVGYVELGLTCAGVCEALNRRIGKGRTDQLSQSVLEAIEKLTATVDEIQRHIIERGKRNLISRLHHAKDDKKAIAIWKLGFERILHVFNAELWINTRITAPDTHQDAANERTIVPDVHRDKLKSREAADSQTQATHARAPGELPPPLPKNTHGIISNVRRDVLGVHRDVVDTRTVAHDILNMLKNQAGADNQPQSAQDRVPGELPPPPPRAFFGRDELMEKIVQLAQGLKPIALIGPGGIGKTSIILTALHDDRIKQRFGNNRWFIRCDQFPPTHTHFLRQLSKVIGAGIENPDDLAPLRQYLSSKEMAIVLDNAESVLDPQGTSAQEIFAAVDELIRFNNIFLCITSRISITPPGCESLEVPTLSREAGHDTFYQIYKHGERTDRINEILEQLDFHPLSITLLATVAQYNKWDTKRLTREWERQRTGVLHAHHSGSLAATIELSLASPMFRDLGPDAREVLGVVAFFPQGINEENADWLFPTISDGPHMFDTFCVLSLTYRSNGFVTMLAPLRDYLRPKDPTSSPLLTTTKECYFSRLLADIYPDKPGFKESQWIVSEDVNVEHLVDVFTSIDPSSKSLWNACAGFMDHLYRHKLRLTVLGPKIEALPDDHPSKAQCLQRLSNLFGSVGNQAEGKRLLTHSLKLWREQGDDIRVAQALCHLSDISMQMHLPREGILHAREASEIFERLGDIANLAAGLLRLASSLRGDGQLDAAEGATTRALDLLPEKGQEFCVCNGHRILGYVYQSKNNAEKAIHHFEVAFEIASSFNWHEQLFLIHFSLAQLFSREGRLDNAHAHVERAKSHAVNDPYHLAAASFVQATLWEKQHMFEEAKSGASHALELLEKLEATSRVEETRQLLEKIDRSARGADSDLAI